MDMTQVWQERCSKFTFEDAKSAFRMNFAGMKFEENELESLAERFISVHSEMQKIELGEIKIPMKTEKSPTLPTVQVIQEVPLLRKWKSLQPPSAKAKSKEVPGKNLSLL